MHPRPSERSARSGHHDQRCGYVDHLEATLDPTPVPAGELGGTVLSTVEAGWTAEAVVRDPQGAVFTTSQFAPPDDRG
ncbi:MAG: hypothetical protein ACRCYR_10520 [Phycicoccus sp.]